MKIRNGFVSNSSSSSFVLTKQNLSEEQMTKIDKYIANMYESGIGNGKNYYLGSLEQCEGENFFTFLDALGINKNDYEEYC